MKQFGKKVGRRGFTLIEVLVTVAVIAVLAAVTIPAVMSQVDAADPTRIVQDLGNVKSGIDAFTANMRTNMPGDIGDLVNAVSSTGDKDGGTTSAIPAVYGTASPRWKGPYIEKQITEQGSASIGDAFPSGYKSFVQQDFIRCNSKTTTTACDDTGTQDYLVVKITPLTSAQFELVNKLIDANETAGSSTTWNFGKLRYDPSASSTAYYYATPLIS